MVESCKRKLTKYQELVEQRRREKWRAHYDPVKIGCKGFEGQSLCKELTKLCLAGRNKMTSIRLITDAAERASRWI